MGCHGVGSRALEPPDYVAYHLGHLLRGLSWVEYMSFAPHDAASRRWTPKALPPPPPGKPAVLYLA